LCVAEKGNERNRHEGICEVLNQNSEWRMHKVSDGERRRVQLLMGLVQPYQVLLLDEVTVDLDVLVRRDLLNFLKSECETRGVTILYATHIFDGIGEWASHIAHLDNGTVTKLDKIENFKELQEIRELRSNKMMKDDSSLLILVENWLRSEFEEKKKRRKEEKGIKTRMEVLQEDYKTHRDKFYNYWR